MMKPKAADKIIHMGTKSAGFSVMRLAPVRAVRGQRGGRLHERSRDPLRSVPGCVRALAIAEDGLTIEIQWTAADVAPFKAGAPHAGAHPLDNKVAFQLGDGADDDHDGAA